MVLLPEGGLDKLMEEKKEFSLLRGFFWPIHRSELKKFFPMFILFFLICFNYSLLKAAKDTLIVTAPSSGAEALPFLKVWVILPAALLITYFYTHLSNRFKRETVFYIVISSFLAFFLLFATVLYPLRDTLHPHSFADFLESSLPSGFKGCIALLRNWTFTTFYIMSEMWSTIIMTVLFWGFANEVTSVKSAKRHYALYGVGMNISAILAGKLSTWISSHSEITSVIDPWGNALLLINGIILLCGVICIALFRYLHKQGQGYPQETETLAIPKKKGKLGLFESFSYLMKNRYLLYIAIIVFAYNIGLNLVEVIWKDQVKALYPNPNDFNAYMGKVMSASGIIATLTALFLTGNVIRRFGWTPTAMITPVVMFVTSTAFFSFLLSKEHSLLFVTTALGSTALGAIVFIGSMQNALSRATKYTLFDTSKELAFIPLSSESKIKGKAAIDGIGSRLGKSGGSLLYQILFLFLGSLGASIPYVAGALLFVFTGWIFAVRSLGKEFSKVEGKEVAA